MDFASQFCYVPSNEQPQILNNQVYTDTNITVISFSFLKSLQNLSLGVNKFQSLQKYNQEPLLCYQCQAVFNYYSKLRDSKQYDFFLSQRIDYMIKKKKIENKDNKNFANLNKDHLEEIEKNPQVKLENANERVWICQFCGYHNKINIDLTEIPESNNQFFLLNNFQKVYKEKKNSEGTIIFCVDNRFQKFNYIYCNISGSMCSTVEIQGQQQQKNQSVYGGLSQEEYELLKQFIDPGSEDQAKLMFQQPNISFISRKQCLVNAIEEQLIQLQQENNEARVGLVSFNNEVEIIGDGIQIPEVFAGDKLTSKEQLLSSCSSKLNQMIQYPVKETTKTIIKVLESFKEQGQTALGPALLCSLEMLKEHKPGSMIILCTDGLANIGLGNLDVKTQVEIEEAEKFYEELAVLAKERGVIISVMTIKGESSKLDVLKKITSITNGNIKIVDPQNLSKGFGKILADKLVGFNTEIEILLHSTARFRNELQNLNQKNILKKNFGNVSMDTKFSFEYDIENIAHIDLYKLKELPYQIKIRYTNENGEQFLKVQTIMLEISRDKSIAEDNCDSKIVEIRMGQVNAQYYAASMQKQQSFFIIKIKIKGKLKQNNIINIGINFWNKK